MVVWAQEHLIGAGAELTVNGVFGRQTRAAVRAFQKGQGLPASGRVDTETWEALLAYRPYRMPWASQRTRGHKGAARPRHPGPPPALGLAAGEGLRDPAARRRRPALAEPPTPTSSALSFVALWATNLNRAEGPC